MMFVSMNHFTIDPEHWHDFEEHFKQRAGLVDHEPGFIRNAVLRPAENSSEQHVILTMWESQQDFENWTQSDAFRKAHEKAGRSPQQWFTAPGKLEVFESVI